MGDPAGIGPEVILKTLCDPEIVRRAGICVVGHEETFFEYSKLLGISPIFKEREPPGTWSWRKVPFMVSCVEDDFPVVPPGRATAEGGRLSFAAVSKALDLVRQGHLDAFVTAPISKRSWSLAGIAEPGHTDFLARETGCEAVMMMVGGRLRVTFVTMHVPLAQALKTLESSAIARSIDVTDRSLRGLFGFPRPRIGVAGVNPHAGETGLFGDEEEKIIAPAVEAAREKGVQVEGPVPPDAVFRLGAQGRYDAVVAMYHDQGLIPLKIVAFDEAVNITLGIPVVRTSPGHGTAFDIAGKGLARHEGLAAAIRQAASLVRRRADAKADTATQEEP